MNIRLDASEISQLADAWRRAPDIVADEFEAALLLSTGMLHSEIVDNTPVGASGGSGAGLSGSINYDVNRSVGEVTGVVGTANPYAVPVEMGTRPHFPPLAPIREWVEARLGVSADEVDSVAFLIARKISREGTQGQFMFRNAFQRLTPNIEATMRSALGRVVQRLEGLA